MRDPELVVRAQLAASALEGAWRRWRVAHGEMADPMPAVSSYVGYSLREPWGQPRVVFGLAAEDAERLAALMSAWAGARTASVPVPRQEPLAAPNGRIGQPLADVRDEPVYRQAAAAMKEVVAAREDVSRVWPEVVSPAWMGALARAASTAKAEAEARIRATETDPDDEPTGTDVLELLPAPDVADGADVAAVEEPAQAPSHDQQGEDGDQEVSDDIPEQDDPEIAASVQSGSADAAAREAVGQPGRGGFGNSSRRAAGRA